MQNKRREKRNAAKALPALRQSFSFDYGQQKREYHCISRQPMKTTKYAATHPMLCNISPICVCSLIKATHNVHYLY